MWKTKISPGNLHKLDIAKEQLKMLIYGEMDFYANKEMDEYIERLINLRDLDKEYFKDK